MKILPIHFDVFALVMLLGVAQGIFLGIFFLTRPDQKGERIGSMSNRCHGFFILAISAINAEIFLNYTNYTFRALWTVDFAEPFNFVLAPLFYFFVFSKLWQRLPKYWFLHLIPFGIWLLNSVTWFYQPDTFKYNAYLHSWHPEMVRIPTVHYVTEDFTRLRPNINELTLLSCLIYAVLALLLIRKAVAQNKRLGSSAVIGTLRWLSWQFALVPILILLVKPHFFRDIGDYLLATYIAITVYTTSFFVMRGSSFFATVPKLDPVDELAKAPSEPKKKYEKSALSEEVESAVLERLNQLITTEKPYLDSMLSLPKLAERLQTSPHHLSQLLNDRLGQTFFDWLATYRVQEAKELLSDPTRTHIKIDEIAEQVGYNSTSAFHTAFKRLTNQTPAQYRTNSLSQRA